MQCLKQKNGMTLVEVLVALTILTIVVVAFTGLFGWSVKAEFSTGTKSNALAQAREKMERLYADIENGKNIYEDSERVSCEDLFVYNAENNRTRRFCVTEKSYIENDVYGYKVTVVVFYDNGNSHVSTSSFILREN